MVNVRKPRTPCLSCGKEPYSHTYKYCSNVCQRNYEYRVYIKRWQSSEIKGLSTIGTVSPHIKRYLREKFENKCHMCGWSKHNPITGQVPLVADHIDGNWRNNAENNLRLLCPNCDALSPTYAGLNRGNGRKNRTVSGRAREGRVLVKGLKKSKS